MLWSEVPPEKRVNRAFLETRNGADSDDGEIWIQRKLRVIDNPRCKMAVRWASGEDVYMPCAHPPLNGEEFCSFHGGSNRPAPVSASEKKRRLLARKVQTARRRLKSAESDLALAESEMLRAGFELQTSNAPHVCIGTHCFDRSHYPDMTDAEYETFVKEQRDSLCGLPGELGPAGT